MANSSVIDHETRTSVDGVKHVPNTTASSEELGAYVGFVVQPFKEANPRSSPHSRGRSSGGSPTPDQFQTGVDVVLYHDKVAFNATLTGLSPEMAVEITVCS